MDDDSAMDYPHDIQPLMANALQLGPRRFKEFRLDLNGDGTIKYRVANESVGNVTISQFCYVLLLQLINTVAEDNFERAFFIVFDENSKTAIDLLVGKPGDEGSCEHDMDLVNDALSRKLQLSEDRNYNLSDLRLSRGHTHPVFYDAPPRVYSSSYYVETHTEKFGALPSNIFGSFMQWQSRVSDSESEVQKGVYQDIIKKRLYKKYCEDYIESYYSSYVPGFNDGNEELSSCFHWIVCPRLNQIGVFEVLKEEFGVVVYHPWSRPS